MAKPIKIEILGDASGFSKAADIAGRGLGNLTVAAAAGAAALAGLAIAGTVELVQLGARFDDIVDGIRVGTGATGDALEDLSDSFKNVASSYAAPLEDAGVAIADLNTRLGLTGKPLEDLAGRFIDLSRITKTELKPNIDRITRVFGDWNVGTENQAEAMDQLYRAVQASGIGLDDLSTSLVQFGAPLRNLGFDLAESQAMLALWNKTGVNTETVVAGLKIGVGTLAKAGEDIPATFRRIIEEITALGPGTEATGLAIQLFGQRAGPDLADAIAGGKFAFDDMLAAVAGGSDTITKAADDTADWAEQWQLIKNRVFIALEPLATKLFTSIGDGLDRVAPLFVTVEESIEAFRGAWNDTDKTISESGFIGWVERAAVTVRTDLVPWLEKLEFKFRVIADQVVPKVTEVFRVLGAKFVDLARFASEHKVVMEGLQVTLLGLAFAVGSMAATIAIAAAAVGLALGAVVIAIAAVVGGLSRLVSWLADARQHWKDLKDELSLGFKNPFDGVTFTNPFSGIGDAIKGLANPTRPTRGNRAMGGLATSAGVYDVGERGRERVFLPQGARVQPAHATTGGGGDTYNIYGATMGAAQLAREIAWQKRVGDGR